MRSEELELLEDVINQACYDDELKALDSGGHSSYADAIRYLIKIGDVELMKESGRRVIGRWIKIKNNKHKEVGGVRDIGGINYGSHKKSV